MNIIVCIKAVPGFIKNPKISDSQDQVQYDAGSIVMNESDDYALEAGIKLAKQTGGQVTAVTAGTLSSQKILQAGLGKNADEAVRVNANLFEPAKTACALAEAIKKREFDLVLTGVESSDNMAAQVGVSIAEMLGIPFAYAVTEMEAGPSENTIKITKELGFGKKQVEEITLPALVCFQTGTEPPSFVPFRKMMMAQSRPIKTFSLQDLGLDDRFSQGNDIKIMEVFSPTEASNAEMITGDPAKQASAAVKIIKEVL